MGMNEYGESDGTGYGAPAQSAREAASLQTPTGRLHLHYAFRDGAGRWTVRQRGNKLCHTPRCRMVEIREVA